MYRSYTKGNAPNIFSRIRRNKRLSGSDSDDWKVSSPKMLSALLRLLPLTDPC